jgi:hypothetical protein
MHMKLNEVLRWIPIWYREGTSGIPGACRCIYLKSGSGVGKSTVLARAPELIKEATGKNIGLAILQAPLLTVGDSIGYLIPKHYEDGHVESLYTWPFWFRTTEGKLLSEYDGGIVVVEEIDKADPDIKKVIGEAALSGNLGPHRLPNGWLVWMAGNRVGKDRSGSTKELDHLINRRREIEIMPDLAAWNEWADENNVHPFIKTFANQHSEAVFNSEHPEKQGPWCTPRSLVMVSALMWTVMGNSEKVPEDRTFEVQVAGNVGEPVARQIMVDIKLANEAPSYDEIVADPANVPVPVPVRADVQMLVVYNLAHRVEEATAAPVSTYIKRLPKEFAMPFMAAACKRNKMLVETPAFRAWISQNASLMNMLAKRKAA